MKVLLAHNFYRSTAPSGEDSVYRSEKKLLERYAEVIPFEKFNDDIDDRTLSSKVRIAIDSVWSKHIYDELTKLIVAKKPDIAHFHNTFPQLSGSVYAACHDNGVPVVQTLHNFRSICANALLLRDGKPCLDCVNGNLVPALIHRCYRGSFAATAAQVMTIQSNRWRGAYVSGVDRYIALTNFAAEILIEGGLPRDRIEIKGNFVSRPSIKGAGDGNYVLFIGRLSEEKGVRILIEAWKYVRDVSLKIVGDGALMQELQSLAASVSDNIEFLGLRSHDEVLELLGHALVMVMPSIWYETFGMVAIESFSVGTPVLASAIGGLNEVVEDGITGLKFEPGNPKDLAEKLISLLNNRGGLVNLRKSTLAVFEEKYTAEKNIEDILMIYNKCMSLYNSSKL
ncbi:glycosyltransferase family 4 protein [Methylococcus sp. EFPC2]|uniref:glycosyltransferase family 4 protein n=1 Tax=Methylococcus sp. EFPC2 TaxID=2812648 RepID=UPI0019683604|nr:glycosyltransferase family 4 protein [Methylococcus sp. EFPC2]QSA98931.1 glycosyltransferase family 4 protein [Methylococcus sp. EFPC2]